MKYLLPYPLLTISCLLIMCITLQAQSKRAAAKPSFCGPAMTPAEFSNPIYKQQFDFMDLKENDTIVDIGAGSGWYEGALSATLSFNKLHFILVDINTNCLNQQKVDNMKAYYNILKGSPINHSFTLVNNTPDSLYLPTGSFKKVWILNTMHEIPDQSKMIRDIYQVLQPGGEVVILEIVPRRPHELHKGCKKPLLSRQEWDQLFTAQHFKVKDTVTLADIANKRSPFLMTRYMKE